MTEGDRYFPFDAPGRLAGKEPADWTKTEARTYLDWLIAQVEPRSARLLVWLGLDDRSDHSGVLREAGAAAAGRLRSPAFSGPGKPVPVVLKGRQVDYDAGPALSKESMALGADLGLLVARYLLADFRGQDPV